MKPRRWILLSVAILLMAWVATGCGTPEPTAEPTEETEAPTATSEAMDPPTATPEPVEEPTATEEAEETEAMDPTPTPEAESEEMGTGWAADGTIADGEYAQEADFDGIRLWWSNDETHLYIAMEGDTTGWVAVGLNPELGMKGADYIFGYVADGEAQLWDAWGTDRTGANHPPDTDLGGSDDIVEFAGVEENGVTRFEAQIPLDSGDEYDNALVPGENYPIIVAIGDQDEYNAYHSKYVSGEISISTP